MYYTVIKLLFIMALCINNKFNIIYINNLFIYTIAITIKLFIKNATIALTIIL